MGPRPAPGNEENRPQVFMLSSGDITPFTLHVRPGIGSPGVTLRVAESGNVDQIHDER
jgi:hypothetical protein